MYHSCASKVVQNENKPANPRYPTREPRESGSSHYQQMHQIFTRFDEEVWIHIEPFCSSPPTIKSTRTSETNPPNSKMKKQKLPTAYSLLNTEIGAENQVLKALKKFGSLKKPTTSGVSMT
jgi:hypothetical protein